MLELLLNYTLLLSSGIFKYYYCKWDVRFIYVLLVNKYF